MKTTKSKTNRILSKHHRLILTATSIFVLTDGMTCPAQTPGTKLWQFVAGGEI